MPDCHGNAACSDTEGSFRCQCKRLGILVQEWTARMSMNVFWDYTILEEALGVLTTMDHFVVCVRLGMSTNKVEEIVRISMNVHRAVTVVAEKHTAPGKAIAQWMRLAMIQMDLINASARLGLQEMSLTASVCTFLHFPTPFSLPNLPKPCFQFEAKRTVFFYSSWGSAIWLIKLARSRLITQTASRKKSSVYS